MQQVLADRVFERFVVLRERSLVHHAAGEETRHAFGIHDERVHAVFRRFVRLDRSGFPRPSARLEREIRGWRAGPAAGDATDVLKDGTFVTVVCSEGDEGKIYDGLLERAGSSAVYDRTCHSCLRRIYSSMNNLDDQIEPVIALDDDSVMQYLLQNPDFFIRNARSVEQMHVPHPVKGSISLVEWQLGRQRHQIAQLEEEITLLMEQASINESLFGRMIELQATLAAASSLQDMLNRLQRWARSLGLAGANVRLFSEGWRIGAPSDFTHLAVSRSAFESMRIQRLGETPHYLGGLNGPELLLLLPQAKAVGSVALSLMGEQGELGVLIFSSRDPQHYQPGMGTVLLDQLAKMLPGLLERWIERV